MTSIPELGKALFTALRQSHPECTIDDVTDTSVMSRIQGTPSLSLAKNEMIILLGLLRSLSSQYKVKKMILLERIFNEHMNTSVPVTDNLMYVEIVCRICEEHGGGDMDNETFLNIFLHPRYEPYQNISRTLMILDVYRDMVRDGEPAQLLNLMNRVKTSLNL